MTPEGRWMVALLATTLGACLPVATPVSRRDASQVDTAATTGTTATTATTATDSKTDITTATATGTETVVATSTTDTAAGTTTGSLTSTDTGTTATDRSTIEFGRKLWGSDYATRADVPAGGTLFSVWTKIPDPGSSYPWSRGNMDVYLLAGNDWYFRCLVGNSSAQSPSNAR